jgi:hypothetical protein
MAEQTTMNVLQLIHHLIENQNRKDDCGQIHLTPEELAIFREAGIDEGSFKAVGWLISYGWFISRETFVSMTEGYPGQYMGQVRAVQRDEAKKSRKKQQKKMSSYDSREKGPQA